MVENPQEKILSNLVEVELVNNSFLKVKETLERIGLSNRKNKTLYQTCHIFHKKGKYYIVHFKEMFLLDGKQSDMNDEDRNRVYYICNLLEKWNLIKIKSKIEKVNEQNFQYKITVLKYDEADQWNIQQKYRIGKKFKNA